MQHNYIFRHLLGILLLFMVLQPHSALAQERDGWSSPYQFRTDGFVADHTVVADSTGIVHAFWSENDVSAPRMMIQYAYLNEGQWSSPIDIYVSQTGKGVHDLEVSSDQSGYIHLYWTGSEFGPLYYTRALASEAASAQNWLEPILIDVPAFIARLQVDSLHGIHIVFGQYHRMDASSPGIYYIKSTDYGATWSQPLWLDPYIPYTHRPIYLEFAIDNANRLHVVWQQFDTDPEISLAQDINYIHSFDDGQTWSAPFLIDTADEAVDELRSAAPVLAVYEDNVHVVWAGTSDTKREHRYSSDGGLTWSDPVRIFGELQGQATDALIVDHAGRIHFVGQIRYPQGIYHAYWENDHWVGPTLAYLIKTNAAEPFGERLHAHAMAIAISREGNFVISFHPSFSQKEFAGNVYAMYRTQPDLASTSPSAITRMIPTATPTTIWILTAESQLSSSASQATPTPVSQPLPKRLQGADMAGANSVSAFWIGITPVGLSLLGLIVIRIWRQRRLGF